jgi:hypothetical protein
MNSTDFAKTIAARARMRAQTLAAEGRRVVKRDTVSASLERRMESVRRAGRTTSYVGGRSRIGSQLPKT